MGEFSNGDASLDALPLYPCLLFSEVDYLEAAFCRPE